MIVSLCISLVKNKAGTMASTFTRGTLNLGLEGFVGDVFANGSKLSNMVGGLVGQGVP